MNASSQTAGGAAFRRPAVSVIVTAYNRAPLLERALSSLPNQTFDDFEIIVVDDASTDNTPQVVAQFPQQDLRYIRHQENQGVGAAYNTGIRAASGSLIAFHDSDDKARPEWLARLVSAFEAAPHAGMAWGRIRAHNQTVGTSAIMYRDPFKGNTKSLIPTMLRWTPGATGLMIRREVFDAVGLMDTEVGGLADLEFTIRFASNGGFEIAYVPEILMDYYTHAGGNISGAVNDRYLGHLQRIVSIHESTLARYPCVHADYMYRLARTMDTLNHPETGRYYREAARLCPTNIRYRTYPIARDLHLTSTWRALSSLRTRVRGRYRNLRGRP